MPCRKGTLFVCEYFNYDTYRVTKTTQNLMYTRTKSFLGGNNPVRLLSRENLVDLSMEFSGTLFGRGFSLVERSEKTNKQTFLGDLTMSSQTLIFRWAFPCL